MKTIAIVTLMLTTLCSTGFADAPVCFNLKTYRPVSETTCGPINGHVEIKDCKTNVVTSSFDATWGVDCIHSPITANLKYHNKMLVGEYNKFEGVSQLILSKTFSMASQREIASERTVVKGHKCFTMIPMEELNWATCAPIETQVQVRDCSTKAPIGPRLNVKSHFTCRGKVKRLKYWLDDSMLVGVLKKTKGKKFKVSETYNLIYPSIYGVYETPRTSNKLNGRDVSSTRTNRK